MSEPKLKIRERLARVCDATVCRVFLALLFLLLFSWPYLSGIEGVSIKRLFAYFFAIWAVLIVVLVAISAAKGNGDDIKNNG